MSRHLRPGPVFALAVASLLLSTVAALGQGRVIDYEVPYRMPIYGGDTLVGYDPTGQVLTDVARGLPQYFYRPMDDLSARAGADAQTMGGAFVSRPHGAMSMSWNPAGLASLQEKSIAFDGFARSSSGNTHADELPDTINVPQSPPFRIEEYTDRLGPVDGFGFAGFASPITKLGGHSLVGGFCFRRHTEISYGTERVLQMGLTQGTGFPFIFGSDNRERGAIYAYTFSLGYQPIAAPGLSLSVGGSANILDGRLRSKDASRVNVRGYREGYVDYKSDYSGTSFELGALLRLKDLVQFGGWASLPYSLKVTGAEFTSLSLATPDQNVFYRVHGRIADYNLEIPLFLSGGVTVGPIKGVTASADVNYRPWSKTDIKYKDHDVLTLGALEIPMSSFDGSYPLKDVTSIHVGAEFPFPLFRGALRSKNMGMAMRLGFRTIPISMPEVDLVNGKAPYYLGDQVTGQGFGLGLSLDSGVGITFHGGIEYQTYSYRKWFLDDTSDNDQRVLSFSDPYTRAVTVDRNSTYFRFSTEMHL
jgi:hypothetical protein